MPDSEQVRSVVVLDSAQLAAAESLATEHGLTAERVPQRGLEPVTVVALVLIGAASAVDVVLRMLEQRKGGQVVDLRPGTPKAYYRTTDVVYGLVIIVTADGKVTVDVKEPAGMFGKVVSALPELLSGGETIEDVARTIAEAFGSDVRVETRELPERDSEQ